VVVWINFFNIAHGTEEQAGNTVCIKTKQTNIVPFFLEYILMKFSSKSQFVTVTDTMRWDLCYHCNITSAGTTDGTDPNQVSYYEVGCLHYECGNINGHLKENSYDLIYNLDASIITYILQ
jgi:hypothetical protein